MNWKAVPEWPRYDVSDTGLVRSRDMVVGARGGKTAVRKGRILAAAKASNGYWVVTVTDGKRRQQAAVHRLVATAFHGAPPHLGAHVLHSDGDKDNNAASNLRWGTPADNHADTEKHGRRRKGEAHPYAKLTEAAVRRIRSSAADASELAGVYSVTREHIWAVRKNRVWRHVN